MKTLEWQSLIVIGDRLYRVRDDRIVNNAINITRDNHTFYNDDGTLKEWFWSFPIWRKGEKPPMIAGGFNCSLN